MRGPYRPYEYPYQAFQRCEAHGCVCRFPFLMAVMEDPLPRWQVITFDVSKSGLPDRRLCALRICGWFRENRPPAYVVFLIELVGNGIYVGVIGHGLVVSRIKNSYLPGLRQRFSMARIPSKLAGLCNGANSPNFSIFSFT